MEEYRKSSNSSTTTTNETINQPSSLSSSSPADNEIRIGPNVAIKRLVDMGLVKLKEHPNIVVVAKGKTINKAITTVEIIKRRLNGTLHQYNQIGKVTLTEQWDPINDNELDKIAVDTMLPVIIIHLSSTTIPELDSTATYQAPHQYD